MENNILVPDQVELIYRLVGGTHVFSSKGIKGLVHVGSHSREIAFNEVLDALNLHVSQTYNCEAEYKIATTYEEFSSHVDTDNDIFGNFLLVTLDKSSLNCH